MLKTEGIVLKEMRYKDTSKILNIYTNRYGKITVLARGAYKAKSRIIANTQPFSYNEYQLYRGKSFFYLNQGDIINSFYAIREKMERITLGSYMLELVDKSMPEEQENEKLFLLFKKGLEVLSSLDRDFLKFILAYELKFISFLGYKPYLDKCVLCGSTDMRKISFSVSEGGIICSNCIGVNSSTNYMNKDMVKVLYDLLYTPLETAGDVNAPKEVLYKLHDIIVEYILFNIDRKMFNSLNMMKFLL